MPLSASDDIPTGPGLSVLAWPRSAGGHHRAKQAARWHLTQEQLGVMTWRLPSGRSYVACAEPYPSRSCCDVRSARSLCR
jgi:hypothetical protein